jgi:transposase
MNEEKTNYIGVDVAKDTLQVQTSNRSYEASYTAKGIRMIVKDARALCPCVVVFEATGGYERTLMQSLQQAGIACNRVNPGLIRAFARSEGIKAKTDPIDARMIQRYACQKQLPGQSLPPPQVCELVALMDRRTQLVNMLTDEKRRLQNSPKCLHSDIRAHLRQLEARVKKIEKHIEAHVDAYPDLRQRAALIQSVTGVGRITAWSILAYLNEITAVNRNQLAALAGVAPFNRDSGKSAGKRAIYGGRAKVRACLYMSAVCAARCNPVIKPYVEGLRNRGKPFKCAMVAAMHKLLIHIQSVLKKHEQKAAFAA